MANYNIKDIEQLSGIRAHTLRIWERRYGIIEPKRTKTNIRYYDDEDLKRILNISILNKSGYKISKIANLTEDSLNREVLNVNGSNETYEIQIGSMVKAMIDFDEILFEKTFNTSVIQLGFDATILKIIYPFFKRIGILWLTGNIDPAQEHFMSNLVRQKIIVAIDSIPEYPNINSESFVLFLQFNQWHEMSLLLSSYFIKKNGHKSIYLGKSLPSESLISVSKVIGFNNIITTVNYTLSDKEIKESINKLCIEFPDKKIYFGGVKFESIPDPKPINAVFPSNLDEFDKILKDISKQ